MKKNDQNKSKKIKSKILNPEKICNKNKVFLKFVKWKFGKKWKFRQKMKIWKKRWKFGNKMKIWKKIKKWKFLWIIFPIFPEKNKWTQKRSHFLLYYDLGTGLERYFPNRDLDRKSTRKFNFSTFCQINIFFFNIYFFCVLFWIKRFCCLPPRGGFTLSLYLKYLKNIFFAFSLEFVHLPEINAHLVQSEFLVFFAVLRNSNFGRFMNFFGYFWFFFGF